MKVFLSTVNRGLAWVVMGSFIVADRVVESAGKKLLLFIPDVYTHTDHMTGRMVISIF